MAHYATALEQAGAASLWVGERLIAATNPKVGYAGKDTIPGEFNSVLDPLLLLGIAAAVTERVALGANVLIAPLYRPAQLARALTTVDVVSNGRLIPGFGIGWSPEEYEAAGVPFTHRGARLDETLDALEAIWTTDPAGYRGRYVSVPEHRSELEPCSGRGRRSIWARSARPGWRASADAATAGCPWCRCRARPPGGSSC